MHTFSIWHWIIVFLSLATATVPAWLIVKKAGYPGALSLLVWVPFLNFLFIWIFALSAWPVTKARSGQV